jgi:hypothetical protein
MSAYSKPTEAMKVGNGIVSFTEIFFSVLKIG